MSKQGHTKHNETTTTPQMFLPFNEDLEHKNTLPVGERLDHVDVPEDDEKEHSRNARMRKLLYSGLVYFEHQLGHQKHGMVMEGGSDSPPVYNVSTELPNGLSAVQGGDLFSMTCAGILITLMERQRRAIEKDLKQILEVWTEFQHNRLSEDKDVRRTAYDILEKRIRESGIIFEKLPEHDPQDFNAGKFRDLAQKYKIDTPEDPRRNKNKAEAETEQDTKPKKKTLRDHWLAAGKFIGEATEEFISAPVNLLQIPFMEAAKASISHFCKYALLKPEAREKHKILKSTPNGLDLSKVTVNSMEVIDNKDFDPELLHELISTRESVRDHIRQDKEASALFIFQSLFMAGQVASFVDNALKGDAGSASINVACLNMASVALRVLAQNKVHLTQALDGERSKMSEQYASVAGLLEKKNKHRNANDNRDKDNDEHPDIANDTGPSPQ